MYELKPVITMMEDNKPYRRLCYGYNEYEEIEALLLFKRLPRDGFKIGIALLKYPFEMNKDWGRFLGRADFSQSKVIDYDNIITGLAINEDRIIIQYKDDKGYHIRFFKYL